MSYKTRRDLLQPIVHGMILANTDLAWSPEDFATSLMVIQAEAWVYNLATRLEETDDPYLQSDYDQFIQEVADLIASGNWTAELYVHKLARILAHIALAGNDGDRLILFLALG